MFWVMLGSCSDLNKTEDGSHYLRPDHIVLTNPGQRCGFAAGEETEDTLQASQKRAAPAWLQLLLCLTKLGSLFALPAGRPRVLFLLCHLAGSPCFVACITLMGSVGITHVCLAAAIILLRSLQVYQSMLAGCLLNAVFQHCAMVSFL